MMLGREVTWYPSYGSEMRGGTANCTIKVSDGAIASPYSKAPDIVCALEEQVTEYFARKGKINPKNSDCLSAGAKL